jgi:hypothetical protein
MIDAGWIAKMFGKIRQHCLNYPLVYGGGGVAV